MNQRKKPPDNLNAESGGETGFSTTGQHGLDTPMITQTEKKFNRELDRLNRQIMNYTFMVRFNAALLELAKIDRARLLVEMGALDDTQIP